jgi:hypothetical protein
MNRFAQRSLGGICRVPRTRRDEPTFSWDQTEIPMPEASEACQIGILNSGAAMRTLAANTPSAVYSAVQQAADFGAAQDSISVLVYQMSQTFGRGSPGSATV